jgi:hypothetical protein
MEFRMMDKILLVMLLMSMGLGLAGWIIHLYTLILSYFSDTKWSIRVSFNDYHEAIPELIIFSGIIIFMVVIFLNLWR